MKIFRDIDNLPKLSNAVATMGSFDGVHCGHQELLRRTTTLARERGAESVVITFEPHPRYALGTGGNMKLLTTLEEKLTLFERAGVDVVLVINFTLEFSQLSPQEFIEMLYAAGVRCMVVGYNHRFGHKKEGDYNYLSTHGGNLEITMVEQQQVANGKVSSTIIRQKIAQGDMQVVEQMLARPYIIIGKMCDKHEINDIPEFKMLPPMGRYQAKVNGEINKIIISKERTISVERSVGSDNVLIEIM